MDHPYLKSVKRADSKKSEFKSSESSSSSNNNIAMLISSDGEKVDAQVLDWILWGA